MRNVTLWLRQAGAGGFHGALGPLGHMSGGFPAPVLQHQGSPVEVAVFADAVFKASCGVFYAAT